MQEKSITTFLNSLRVEENTELLPSGATREVGGERKRLTKCINRECICIMREHSRQ